MCLRIAARSQPGPAPREEPAQHRGAQRSAQVVPALGPVQTAHRECAPGSAGFGHVDAFGRQSRFPGRRQLEALALGAQPAAFQQLVQDPHAGHAGQVVVARTGTADGRVVLDGGRGLAAAQRLGRAGQRAQRGERQRRSLAAQRVDAGAAAGVGVDQSRASQQLEVGGDPRLVEAQPAGQVADAGLAGGQLVEEADTGFVAQHPSQAGHGGCVLHAIYLTRATCRLPNRCASSAAARPRPPPGALSPPPARWHRSGPPPGRS